MCDLTRHVVNFVINIELEYVYVNVGLMCCTSGKWMVDKNISKEMPLKENII